ncbi:OFA family MFS transporter [uncultured Clostridium sp.]|uniref:L-lactate MFS transporter n=1 Tax=uncultured Clostridium sp. TaxID=59620 RepID=UPI0026030EFA|nr:OFA family MFS transporter [uncultured Clostridium sp.]
MSDSKNKRTVILIGTMLAQLGLGTLYTWSLFNKPLGDLHGWSVERVVLSFSITSFSLAIGTLFSGKLQELFGIKKVTIICAVVLGAGLIIAPRMNSLTLLYIFAGVVVGLADGVAYMLTLTNCIKWFPEKKGVISGISIGCYGLGSLIFKYINSWFLKEFGVVNAFTYWGICAFILVFIGGVLLKDAIVKHIGENRAMVGGREYKRSELFSSPQAYLLFIAFLASCLGGLYVIGAAKNVGMTLAHLTAVDAGNAVAIIAIFNTIGRFVLGSLSDKIQRTKVAAIAFAIIIISSIILIFAPLNYELFLLSVGGIAFSFGGNLTVFPAVVGEYFGLANSSKNYGIIYQGFGIGGLLGGVVANVMGGLKPTFYLVLVLGIVAFLIMLFIKAPKDAIRR